MSTRNLLKSKKILDLTYDLVKEEADADLQAELEDGA